MKRWFLRLLFLCLALLVILLGIKHQREHRFDKFIVPSALKYKTSPALVKAIIWQESRFNPNAKGGAGEIGLMQIRSAAAHEWAAAEKITPFTHQQIFDPAQNIDAGTWYIAKLSRRYPHTDNPLVYALADYNAGRGNVLRWIHGAGATNSSVFLEQMTYPGTRKYITNVLERMEKYEPRFAKVVEARKQ
ncbi:MAG: lytic transglycosylase domain-containing protein [Limisphaerales bacterium]